MAKEYTHIFLRKAPDAQTFKSRKQMGGARNIPERERGSHSEHLTNRWRAVWKDKLRRDESATAVSMPLPGGFGVQFEGKPGCDLITKSLENRPAGIRLLNVYTVESNGNDIVRATVFIPTNKRDYFLKKIQEYANKSTREGNPKHAVLMRSIENIRLAILEDVWCDDPELMPTEDDSIWCEMWLMNPGDALNLNDEVAYPKFHEIARKFKVEIHSTKPLHFPERIVLLAKANRKQLADMIEVSPEIAEIRKAKETAQVFYDMDNKEQAERAQNIRLRLKVNPEVKVAVCVLDTGANNGHILLKPVLSDSDCHAVNLEWENGDYDGHGTSMCGLVAFGDLLELLQSNQPVNVEHCLESVKILPPGGNKPDLYGEITIQGMNRAEIQAPERSHIGCMAITAKDTRDRGRPSSWSAAIDNLTSGHDDSHKRLFIISAGNVPENEAENYPNSNLTHSIHDPGQSWNALTVGAFTEKHHLSGSHLIPIAGKGELSPFSSTSLTWESKWPVKPDIVLEGGNLAKNPDNFIGTDEDLSLISTNYKPAEKQFCSMYATSAATAQAAWMAAQIQARYPDAWPETVRGLMIHSSEWPDTLKRQFRHPDRGMEYSKTDYKRLMRICGYGVPNLQRALACASNSLTLISESEIQPYTKPPRKGCTMKDMHLHRIPWPKDVLRSLPANSEVTMRVTLSYFIEPGPGEIGWKDKYRYPSYGLRFDVNEPEDTEERFQRRINANIAAEEGGPSGGNNRSNSWDIGANGRNTGSVHSDILKHTAESIAACNLIGIYPVVGWWRERHWLNCWDKTARYSLIISLHTPNEDIDIYTPVATQLEIPIVPLG